MMTVMRRVMFLQKAATIKKMTMRSVPGLSCQQMSGGEFVQMNRMSLNQNHLEHTLGLMSLPMVFMSS